ncbi:hypothetical protein BDFB_007077 [Asbolus verrucosus]|uniref:DDE Tnp 4 domain containing protein n=1 Tax=Asbolus verrucosus TaxID=1661398 RepID=A0A482VZ23_ASBVE|nr:hypothetical protein BDFB_007077 [Asbolus verrucosus]
MTPLLNPITQAELNYNTATRQQEIALSCFGAWKRRFACPSLGLRTKLDTSLIVIVATAVLHNIAVAENDPVDFEVIEQYEDVEEEANQD